MQNERGREDALMKTLKDERTNESGRIDGQIGPHAVQDKAELLSKQPQLMTDQSRNILRLPALLRLYGSLPIISVCNHAL